MKRFYIFLLVVLIFISGCNGSLETNEAKAKILTLNQKQKPSYQFFITQDIKPLKVSNSNNARVLEWFSDTEVLLQMNVNGVSTVQKYNLYSGTSTRFFETVNPIVNVKANKNNSYFMIQVLQNNYNFSVYIVDREGNLVKRWDTVASELNSTWNPYDHNQLLIVSLLPNWEFNAFYFNLEEETITQIPVANPFVDWLTIDTVAYLNWDQSLDGSTAPLQSLHVKSHKVTQVLNNIEAFFTFKDLLLTVSQSTKDADTLKYNFYRTSNFNKLSEISIPVVTTYSEHFWVSNHVYIDKSNLLYLIKPVLDQGQIRNYQLIEVKVLTGEQREVTVLEDHVPLMCSPEGNLCLKGRELEQIIKMDSGKIMPLLIK